MVKLIYKWILVIIVAFFVAFPLGFIPLKYLEGITINDTAFLQSADDSILAIYLFYVLIVFVGILLAFLISLLIKSVSSGEKLINE